MDYGRLVSMDLWKSAFITAISLSALALVPAQSPAQTSSHGTPMVLWYRQPAPEWTDALPIGNGRMGAMVFGGANIGGNNGDAEDDKKNSGLLDGSKTRGQDEHLQLNEASVWQGSRADRLNPAAGAAFPQIRKLLLDSKGIDGAKISEAEKLAQADLIAIPARQPGYSTLGDLYLRSADASPVTDYRRELDLDTGIARTTYTQNSIHFTREVFATAVDGVIVLHISADRPYALNFSVSMDRPEDFATQSLGANAIMLRDGPQHKGDIHFRAIVRALSAADGHVVGNTLAFANQTSVTLLISAATDFKGGNFPGGDPQARCEQLLHNAARKDYAQLRSDQLADQQKYFRRVWLQLGPDSDPFKDTPTDERMKRVQQGGDDLHLQMLYFQFARYLLIGSSRPGAGIAANLQGLWASGINNPWGSKFTININTEMNYWPVEAANLEEMHEPLFALVEMVKDPATGTGMQVAKKYYGARGFVAHHNTDIWGDAEPIDSVCCGVWPMGGAWLSLDFWDHYAFTGDKDFLRSRGYPALQNASQFFLDYLVEDDAGHLLTGPSISPENRYKLPDGTVHGLTMAPTMDIEIVRELFSRTISAANILGVDADFRAALTAAIKKLPPFKIGKFGQLQEWQLDYDENAPGHRHISHLWALYPGNQISLDQTPELAKAARATLQRRLDNGGGQTGWSRAWVVNYWDRLGDGNQAYNSLQVLFKQSTFPNMMDTHPPGVFQIDGNLGAAAGMMEALLQSRWTPEGCELHFLPALPHAWAAGAFTGLRARGGDEVSLTWNSGKAATATLHATEDGTQRLFAPQNQRLLGVTSHGKPVSIISYDLNTSLAFHAVKGETYTVAFQ
jgi:alpha-L-fucosidase 2